MNLTWEEPRTTTLLNQYNLGEGMLNTVYWLWKKLKPLFQIVSEGGDNKDIEPSRLDSLGDVVFVVVDSRVRYSDVRLLGFTSVDDL